MNPTFRAILAVSFFLSPFVCSAQTGQKGGSAPAKTETIRVKKPKEARTDTLRRQFDPPVVEPVEEFSDEEPFFPNFNDYISRNLRYPSKAMADSTQGNVIAKFIVEKTGKLSNITLEKQLSPECDAEVIRLLKSMPPWTPGKTDGIPVRVNYSATFKFKLKP